VDPARYEHERRAVFAKEWLWFATTEQLGEPGRYIAQVYAGWPLFVQRGASGELRGFHNVCRHRAGPLVDDGVGVCKSLVCRYHGWAYASDGRLRSARDFGADLDAGDFALHPIKVSEWRGQVFVNLDMGAAPLCTDLAAFFAECEGFPIETMVPVRAFRHDLACNWKTYCDNYLEGYHIPLLHPELNRQFDAKRYRVDLGDRYCRHSAPRRDGAATANGRWLFRWPNLAMNVYGDSMNVEVVVPTGPQSCSVLYNHFFVDRHAPDVADVIALSDLVMEEDRRMVEVVQRNLAAGSYDTGRLSPRHEHGLAQFQDLVRAARGGWASVRSEWQDARMTDERIEVQRTIEADPATIFAVISDPQGHVRIDSSGMLMSAEGERPTAVGDTFVVHMDREALNDMPLGKYDVTILITTLEPDREIAWTIGGNYDIGHVYGYRLEAIDGGTLVTSYYDWSTIADNWRELGIFPVIPESALRATLGILARTVQEPGGATA
jgi:choline monooxygenase